MRDSSSIVAVGLLALLMAFAMFAIAAKPPEKIEDIDCSIFDAMPILQEVRPFLAEPQAPENVDFKTRLAYTEDWNQRRAIAATRLDRLIEVCRVKLAEQQKNGD